ncbi:hypothetical protein CRM22_007691 [Opisthorchis felineus]|uniref:Uncharacterized protein n=1 Tax=Opisthorchis felineus TaxID=147828 RepID=A0A4S2LEP6_OPIFE|nr:hypothetical protein CRM22_007691 [Opisthorchis felineus]
MTEEHSNCGEVSDAESYWEEELRFVADVKEAVAQFVETVRNKMESSLNQIVTREERRKLGQLLDETEKCLRDEGDAQCAQQLGKLRRLFIPMERRLIERQVALRDFRQTIEFMREWLKQYSAADTKTEPVPKTRRIRLDQMVSEYEKWFQMHQHDGTEEPEDFALKTAQLVAHQHALEVAWSAIVDGQNISVTLEEDPPESGLEHPGTPNDQRQYSQDLSVTRSTMKEYIEEMIKKIQGPLQAFVDEVERARFLSLLIETNNWLQRQSDHADWQAYEDRLRKLEVIGILLEQRLYDRVEMVKKFKCAIEHYQHMLSLMRSGELKYAHVEPHHICQLQTLLDQYDMWLREQQLRQQCVEHYDNCCEDPQLNTLSIAHRLEHTAPKPSAQS